MIPLKNQEEDRFISKGPDEYRPLNLLIELACFCKTNYYLLSNSVDCVKLLLRSFSSLLLPILALQLCISQDWGSINESYSKIYCFCEESSTVSNAALVNSVLTSPERTHAGIFGQPVHSRTSELKSILGTQIKIQSKESLSIKQDLIERTSSVIHFSAEL